MQSHFLLVTLALVFVFLTSSLSAHAKAPHARNVLKARQGGAADLDAAQASQASLALSIYNSVGTTAFAAATAGVCATGFQTYTAASGTVRCCVGSVVDGICFTDTRDIIYAANPAEVLNGDVDPPTVSSSATAAVGTATRTSTTSTINYLTATTFRATATGATTGAAAAAASTSTSYSQLSQTLTPTGSSGSSSSTSGALAVDVGMLGLLGSLAAVVAGGIVAML